MNEIARISLLTPEYYDRKAKEQRFVRIAFVLGIVFTVVLVGFSLTAFIAAERHQELVSIEARSKETEEKIKALNDYKLKEEQLQLQEKILQEAHGFNPDFPLLIKEIGKTVPQEVVLDSIACVYDYKRELDKNGKLLPGTASIKIIGTLYGTQRVVDYWAAEMKGIDGIGSAEYVFKDENGLTKVEINVALKIGGEQN